MQQSDILILVLVGAALLAIVLLWLGMRRRQSAALRQQFGAEYDRTVQETGHRSKAEANLVERAHRVAALDIRPLTPVERRDFSREWLEVKAVFVDSPPEAVLHADRLVTRMLQARGYPMADFDRRYEDLTVDHAAMAGHYRAGHTITDRLSSGQASTEDLRQAIKHYEALFDAMMADVSDTVEHRPVTAPATPQG